jgi:hypothetical protein
MHSVHSVPFSTLASSACRHVLILLPFVAGCGAPEPPGTTGGTSIQPGRCGRGVAVVSSDYHSSNVSLVDLDGRVLSSSFISSASAKPGLSAPLSDDVVLPTQTVPGTELVLIDRNETSVISWVDVASGSVRAQLPVGTEFAANPRDYVALTETRAYVTRYQTNTDPGQQPFDAGGDILRIDPSQPAVLGRIDLTAAFSGEDPRFLPHPDRAVRLADQVYVVLGGYTADFSESRPRLAVIDPARDALVATYALTGLAGCTSIAASPSGERLAIACLGNDAKTGPDSSSAVVIMGLQPELTEISRTSAPELGDGSVSFFLDFASDKTLLVVLSGNDTTNVPDTLLELADDGGKRTLLRADRPFTLGDVRCFPDCRACFVADASRGSVVQRFAIDELGHAIAPETITVDRQIGLPARYLGGF